jgi:hypothetical protein
MSVNTEIFTDRELDGYQNVEPLVPLLRNWFDLEFPILDFGCGPAFYIDRLSDQFKTIGIEGNHFLTRGKPNRIQWDLNYPIWIGFKGNVLCVEVMEHIDASHHDTIMDTLSRHCARKLCLTWAIRGQGSLRHVAERDENEVVPYISQWGLRFLAEETHRWRQAVTKNCPYMGKSLYLFER